MNIILENIVLRKQAISGWRLLNLRKPTTATLRTNLFNALTCFIIRGNQEMGLKFLTTLIPVLITDCQIKLLFMSV